MTTTQRTSGDLPAQRVPARTADNRSLAVLLAAAFAGPWLVWGSAIAQDRGLIGGRLPQGIALWSLVPALVLAVTAVGGRPALVDLAGRVVRFRAPARCYLLALAVPVAIAAGSVAVVHLAGGPTSVGQAIGLPGAVGYFCYGTGLYLLTEEAVWRGAVLPRLQARTTPLAASLLLGAVWAVWHLPLLSVPGEGDEGLPVAPFALLVVGTSVLVAALTNAARGSVVVAATFHAAFNAAYSYAGVVGPSSAVLWTAAALTGLAATAVAVGTRGRLGLAVGRA